MKRTAKATGIAIGLLGLPTVASACASCRFAQTEHILPHSTVWYYGMTIWFCAVMVLASSEKELYLIVSNLGGHAVTSIALAFSAYFFGFLLFGPLPFGLLGLLAASTTAKGFTPKIRAKLPKIAQVGLKTVSALAFACMLTGLVISMRTKATRSDADFILQWGGYQGEQVLHRLLSEPAKNEEQLRQILGNIDHSNAIHKYFAEEISGALEKLEKERLKTPADGQ
ncbi:MAG: hypothetical protein ACL93V_09560 [Candidatus Electrothrix sp. YB6]